VVFHPLKREQLQEVLNIELAGAAAGPGTAKGQVSLCVTDAGRDFLLQEGTDQRYGARHLKRAIERSCCLPAREPAGHGSGQFGRLGANRWTRVTSS